MNLTEINTGNISLDDINQITLDLSIHKIINVRCKQNDFNSRKLLITVTNDGKFFPIDETIKARYKLCKADHKYIYNDVTEITEDGKIYIDLTEQCTACTGTARAELQLTREAAGEEPGQIISSMPFQIIIEKSVVDNTSISSSDEFDALNQMLLQAKELPDASVSSKGITQLTDSVSSTSTSTAATPNSVKQTYEKAAAVSDDLDAEITRAKNAEQLLSDAIKNQLEEKAPLNHASTADTYGKGTTSSFGHVKLSDSYTSAPGTASNASSGVAASLYTAQQIYSDLSKVKNRVDALDGGSYSLAGKLDFGMGASTSTVNTSITKINAADSLPFTITSSLTPVSIPPYFTATTNTSYYYKFVKSRSEHTMNLYYNLSAPPTATSAPNGTLLNSSYMVNDSDSLDSIEYGTIQFLTGRYYYGFNTSNTTVERGGTLYLYTKE